jgi:hypothetical protein
MIVKTYNLSKQINYDILTNEITNSNCVQDFSGLCGNGGTLEVLGASLLDSSTLDSIVDSHTYIDNPVFKLTGSLDSPVNIDYDVFGLHKKRTLNQGELSLVEYFKNYDGETYSDLVVKEERTYTRDSNNLVQYRTQTSTWYLTDDTVGATKTTTKYYSIQESVAESETRRGNLVATAKLYTLSQIGIENCWDFLNSINNEMNLYIQGATGYLFDAIANSDKAYMTNEIKGTLAYILTIN